MADDTPDRVEMAKAVEAALDEMESVLGQVDLAKLEEPAAEGGWRRRDALAHMVYWQEVCVWALRSTMDGTYAPVDLSDIDAVNAKAADDKAARATADLIEDFRRTGREIVEAINAVPDELWHSKPRLYKWVETTTIHHYGEHRGDLAAAKADPDA